MEKQLFKSDSPQDQSELVEYLVARLKKCPIACFYGEMGAGKTTLIKNICNLLKLNEEVSSPTFSLVNEYYSPLVGTLYHFDFYRIKDESEAMDMGVEEYFYSGDICLIEWPEMIPGLIPENYIRVEIKVHEAEREIAVITQ